MSERYRFLSVRLSEQHICNWRETVIGDASTELPAPATFVIECEDGQCWFYNLSATDKIASALQIVSLEAGFRIAEEKFGIAPNEWVEDSNH